MARDTYDLYWTICGRCKARHHPADGPHECNEESLDLETRRGDRRRDEERERDTEEGSC